MRTFFSEQISQKIPNKINDDIYTIYTDYASNYQGKHTAITGHKITSLNNVPTNLIERNFKGGEHYKFLAKGVIPTAVLNKWKESWDNDKRLNRSYYCGL